MKRRTFIWLGGGVAAAGVAGFGGFMLSLPPSPQRPSPQDIPRQEVASTLAALKPPKRQRPLIAIVGINDATETTDYLVPYGILRRADVADVNTLSTAPGMVKLFPALKVQPNATIADFDAQHSTGADYVIVPAMSRDDDPVAVGWIKEQAQRGAIIIGICAGAKVVAAAGLLDDRRATTHWHYLDGMLKRHPTIQYVPDRRFVVDRGVATTTGISASMPMMLTLIEAIAGEIKAREVARDLGVGQWDARHDSEAFKLTRPFAMTVMGNSAAIWHRDRLAIEVRPEVDEVSLALVADAWSRTYRSHVTSVAATSEPVQTRGGLMILPDESIEEWKSQLVPSPVVLRPAQALDDTLRAIARRYGNDTAHVVAMQLEYPIHSLSG
jgi:transcriptional regulator GlxA family with amidase domain